ncbi:23S rRNA (uracil(1939)-C(5))-methyltransferase RlmD [Maridesulfovibrio sp.]|uniref:23S rRNA (uracil(1939)-C(5))-methyltransferase RlmD n=1 Tax=Maridesulfovibrio sp. TaxID=2795000 RepID=UPI002A18C30C|nr:23S rRNA (uracil(1939)-C(5))-methyltransferase RlmD [Maridesulfovibrio sp.]
MSKYSGPLQPGSVIECEIESLVFGGKGIARHDGLAVFVDRAVPGQKVRCEITGLKKRFAEARRLDVLRNSESECEPSCPLFGDCGGCSHQDMTYDAQLYWKGRQVSETLQRIGRVSPETPGMGKPAIASPETFGYRNKLDFSFSGQGPSLQLGFKKTGSETEVLNVPRCPLLPESCAGIPGLVRAYCAKTGVGAYMHGKGGYWRKLVVRVARATGEIMVHLITAPAESHEHVAGLEKELFEHVPQLASFAHSTRRGRADLATGEQQVSLSGKPFITEQLFRADGVGINYRISPNSFFQTNSAGAEILFRRSLELASPVPGDVVYDLFCGSGGIGLFMARDVQKVIGIEASQETVLSARDNAGINGVENAEYMVGNLARKEDFPSNMPVPDIVVVDPPRNGVPGNALQRILQIGPAKVLYISCNPATLARDVLAMSDNYDLDCFSAVDMFPHTSHVECIALLTRSEENCNN